MKTTIMAGAIALALAPDVALADYANPDLIATSAELKAEVYGDGWIPADGFVVVDVRPESAYRERHLPGAINIPYTALTDPRAHVEGALKPDGEIARLFGDRGIDAATQVVLYDDQGGFRASRLFWLLEYYGHRRVSVLDGGIGRWMAEGGPLEVGPDRGAPRRGEGRLAEQRPGEARQAFPINATPRRIASADYILERRADPGVAVIDVRPAAAFAKGHIPWARSIPWKTNLNADQTMRSAEDLAAHYAGFGVGPDKNVVVHCQTGESAGHTYFALRLLGYPRVRVYHRSWAEWGVSDDLPKVQANQG